VNVYSRETLGSFVDVPEEQPWQPPPWPKDCPGPGIYRDVPYDEYKAWPAVNASALRAGVELSPLHMRHRIESGDESDTRARKFGRATHCRFLEPQAFAERFLIAEPCSALLKSGKRKGEPCGASASFVWVEGPFSEKHWFCGTHRNAAAEEPREYIQQDEADRIERMFAAVKQHQVVALLRQQGGCEVSVIWDRDGIPCKARLDKLIEEGPDGKAWIVDLKKCGAFAIDDRSINRSIVDYYYDLQGWWYSDGHSRLTGKRTAFAWVFVEDGPPYDVRPKVAIRQWLAGGKSKAEWAFGLYRRALQTGEWCGVSPSWDTELPPEWYCKRYGVAS